MLLTGFKASWRIKKWELLFLMVKWRSKKSAIYCLASSMTICLSFSHFLHISHLYILDELLHCFGHDTLKPKCKCD